ncbi:MAG: hypothetical protein AVDCRST_MAG93-294, partial [uncultured Chloroflexia bacterium]
GPAKEGLFIANLKDGATLIAGRAHVQAVRYRSSNKHTASEDKGGSRSELGHRCILA